MRDMQPRGIAPRIRKCRAQKGAERERCYLELMSVSVFKGGLNYDVVNAKWDGIREAFRGFDVDAVADMTAEDVQRVEEDPGIIHNKRKVEGVVHNARRMRELAREHGSFSAWLDSLPDPDARVKALHREFMFMGPTTAYYFLHYSGEEIPGPHEWAHEHAEAVAGRRRR